MEIARVTLTAADLALILGIGGAILAILIALYHEQRNSTKAIADNATKISSMETALSGCKDLFAEIQKSVERRMHSNERRLKFVEKRMDVTDKVNDKRFAAAEKRLEAAESRLKNIGEVKK